MAKIENDNSEMSDMQQNNASLKKMMYHDVADISTYNSAGLDGSHHIPFVIPLEADTIRLLQQVIEPQNLIEDINTMLQARLYLKTQTTRLVYKGKDKLRSDVLDNFKAIADLLIREPDYPELKFKPIKKNIKLILGRCDDRVLNQYIKSIKDCIALATGKSLSFYDTIDCSPLIKAINEK